MIKIAINGFGRIGRPTLRRILEKHPELEVVAINDLTDTKTLAHLLKYDSNYGKYDGEVSCNSECLIVKPSDSEGLSSESEGKVQKIKVFAEKEPEKLSWKEMGIDVVLECTGFFTDYDGAAKHLKAGAKKVIVSAPCKGDEMPTYVLGVNEEKYDSKKDNVISMASCTTNCLAPVMRVICDNFTVEKALMSTAHAYTNDQRILDLPHKDLRRARAAGLSIIPTTTGAAIAVTKTIPELTGKFHGVALRVPVSVVSICDVTIKIKEKTDIEKINNLFKQAASNKLKGILAVEEGELVSIDFKGNDYSSIIDAPLTMVMDGDLIKIMAWYDNEWGYACRLAEMAEYIGKKI